MHIYSAIFKDRIFYGRKQKLLKNLSLLFLYNFPNKAHGKSLDLMYCSLHF